MQQFDIRAVRREDIELIQTMYEHDIWMQYEMVDRHKGIATESSFSLAMYRWVNTIIEFISVVEQMDKIGINEIDAKIEKLRSFQSQMRTLLDRRSTQAPFMLFKELRQKEEVAH